ncbi:MAG: preprotein translocase subunit YajC [Alphaproteobacteria bacterium]|nr:preprotein translocase subunit YajC [Alphaproteobacteria bacterium]MBQ3039888.1 preprotein translocase subunit YajC [Alphaproteobacteria bacterium]MBQ7127553.1 preprotein translocase subunit YajC [Alphaproteobacteria bacterium]MBR2393386.1 preprotein translocase subunit YajC [Alphaproteobacteria bacterium]
MDQAAVVVDNATQTVATAPQGDIWGMVLYLIIVFGIIYFLMVRPNKKRMAEYQKMLDALKVGNRVMAAGIYGTIKKINDKTIEMEVAKGVVIEVNKNAVASVEE